MIDLQLPNLFDNYTFFDILFQTVNIFTSLQDYIVVRRKIRVSRKRFLRKIILIYN